MKVWVQNSNSSSQPMEQPAQRLNLALRVILCFTGLHFSDNSDATKWHRSAKKALALGILALATYHTLWKLVSFLLVGTSSVISVFVLCWTIKGLLAQLFLFHWQRSGQLSVLLRHIASGPLSAQQWTTIVVALLCFALFALTTVVNTALRMSRNYFKPHEMYMFLLYGSEKTIFVTYIVWTMLLYAATVVYILFNLGLQATHHQLHELFSESDRQKMALMSGEECKTSFANDRVKQCQQLVRILKQLEALNTMFQVYLLVMIGSNIPSLLITTIHLFTSVPKTVTGIASWAPTYLYCLFEFLSLTLFPARVHSLISSMPSNFEDELPSAKNVHDKMLRRVNKFVKQQCTRYGVGITPYGFFTINKSLILTMLSLMVSYSIYTLKFMMSEH